MSDEKPYLRSLDDEIDWKLIDQLHNVVSQISGFCFETKKLCVTTQFVVLAFLVNFTDKKPDKSLFIAGISIPLSFWFLDSVAYYYQVKIRGVMNSALKSIQQRRQDQSATPFGIPLIEPERTKGSLSKKAFQAAINHSMWVYFILAIFDLITWYLFYSGSIK